MRLFWVSAFLIVFLAACWVGGQWYAQDRVRIAFLNAGLRESAAVCMGQRLVDRLSFYQLYKLDRLQGSQGSVSAFAKAIEDLDDPQIVKVTGSSLLLCNMGLGS